MRDAIDQTDPLRLDDIPDAASLIHVTVERLFSRLKAHMGATLADHDSSIVEWRILLMLRIHDEMAQKDLVREVAMVQAQVSRTLATMRKRGLIRARRSARDRRVWLFRLTPSAIALYRKIAPTMERRKRLLDDALSPGELDSFLQIARKIADVATIETTTAT